MKACLSVACALCFVCMGTSYAANDDLCIAKDSVAEAVIIVARNATAPEKHAAKELAKFLGLVTKASFGVQHEYDGPKPRILVGPSAALLANKNFATQNLTGEELVIRTAGRDLILAGRRPRGTLYAVYTFLEDTVGCRWWSSQASTIPTSPTLIVPPQDHRLSPAFEMRESDWADAKDPNWAVRNRVNGSRTNLDALRGGKYADLGGGHSFYKFLSPDEHFDAHPEWFSLVDGKRLRSGGQLCLTNEAMRAEFIESIKHAIRTHPGVSSIWAGQMDWDGHCECGPCAAIDEREGTPAGSIIDFVNAVATATAEEFPEVTISTFAYTWSQKPPKSIKAHPNVIVWLCTTGCSFAHPLTDTRNQTFREALDGWAQHCERIYIFDYATNFAHYLCPHPNVRTLAPNMKYYASHNVKGVLSLGAFTAKGAEMAELRAWVVARLLWDPTHNGDELISEFLEGYYGPAAEHIRAYVDVFERAIDANGMSLGMYEPPVASGFLTAEALCKGLGHLRDAKAAVAKEAELLKRVEVAELSLLYPFMLRWDELKESVEATPALDWPFEGVKMREVYDRFLETVEASGIKHYSEAGARDWFASIKERAAIDTPLTPPGCEEISRQWWADLQDAGLVVKSDAALAKRVADDQASDGSAAWMPGTHDKRAVHRELWRVPLVTAAALAEKRVSCKISIKCDAPGEEGIAFRCGISKANTLEALYGPVLEIRAADITDTNYHTYDLGTFENIRGWNVMWVSPASNPENAKGIWIDRMWLVCEDGP